MAIKRKNKNDGTIIQLKNGKWRAQISLGYKEDGTRNRPSEVFETEKEAVAWKNKMLARAETYGNASVIDQSGMFLPKYHKWLMNIKKVEIYSRQFKTIMSHYNNWVKRYFLKTKEKEITQSIMQNFFNYLEENNVGKETRKKIKCELHQYF